MTNLGRPNTKRSAPGPERTCVGCARKRPARELFRIAVVDGDAVHAPTAPGRGAWVCGPDCMGTPRAHKSMERTLRKTIPKSRFTELADDLSALNNSE